MASSWKFFEDPRKDNVDQADEVEYEVFGVCNECCCTWSLTSKRLVLHTMTLTVTILI